MQRLIQDILEDPYSLLCVVLYAAAGLISGVWVAVDARNCRVPSHGDDYNVNTGAVSWFLGCLFLWLLVVPVYFIRRASVLRRRGERASSTHCSSSDCTVSSMARSVIALVMLVACGILGGIGGWYVGRSVLPAASPGTAGFGALAMVGPDVLVGLIAGWALSRWATR